MIETPMVHGIWLVSGDHWNWYYQVITKTIKQILLKIIDNALENDYI